jgi:hypothetical protein
MTPPNPFTRTNLYLSLGCIAAALVIALVWVPLDSGTGLIEKVRRQVSIGDALAPTIAAGFIGIGGLLVFIQKREPYPNGVTWRNLGFLATLLAGFAASFAAMRWTGPAVVAVADLFTEADMSYRALRDTAPWKYLGFLVGGTGLIAGMIGWIEGRLTRRTMVIALTAICILIVIYDLPFDDLLLPPNGDV